MAEQPIKEVDITHTTLMSGLACRIISLAI